MRRFFLLLRARMDERFDISRFLYSDEPGIRFSIAIYKLVKLVIYLAAFTAIFVLYTKIGEAGLAPLLPTMSYFLSSIVSFLIIIMSMNELLTGNEDSEFLLSTEISEAAHVILMLLTLYVRSMVFVILVCVPGILVYYPYVAHTDFVGYWILGILLTPLPTGGIAALVGMALTLTLADNPKRNQLQSVLSIACVIAGTVLIFLVANKVSPVLQTVSNDPQGAIQEIIGMFYSHSRTTRMFHLGIVERKLGYTFLFIFMSIIWYLGYSLIIIMGYRIMIISFRCPIQYKEYTWTKQKAIPVHRAMYIRELQHFVRSKSYFTQGMLGIIIGLIVSVGSCIIKDPAIAVFVSPKHIPALICLFVGLSNTTYCALSMEGKRYWIMEASPVQGKIAFRSKIMVNLTFTIPFSIISAICFLLIFHPNIGMALSFFAIPMVFAVANAFWGIMVDQKFGDTSKESETQAMHQGLSYVLGYLPGILLPLAIFVTQIF